MKKLKLLSLVLVPVLALLAVAATQTWRNVDATGTFRGTLNGTLVCTNVTTNQITFAQTNTFAVTTSVVEWVSVKITGKTNQYRLPLYQ